MKLPHTDSCYAADTLFCSLKQVLLVKFTNVICKQVSSSPFHHRRTFDTKHDIYDISTNHRCSKVFREWMHKSELFTSGFNIFKSIYFVGLSFFPWMVIALMLALKKRCLLQAEATSTCAFHHTAHIPFTHWTDRSSYH